jgi:parvulin-like peptidyl-prolyl isomerase
MNRRRPSVRSNASILLVATAAVALLLAPPPRAIAEEGAPADSAAAARPAPSDSSTTPTPAPSTAKAKGKAKKKAKTTNKKGTPVTESTKAAAGTMPVAPATPPEHVQVQHILIGFAGSVPGKDIRRTKDEAKKLAYEILDRARKGEDFGALVEKYTDDSPPGIYGMSGRGIAPAPGEYSRDGMVPAFGNVGFAISPGNIGIADYDPAASPYGWHVIKRLK